MQKEWSLPIGFKDVQGTVHRKVVVSEITGYDEEFLLNGAKKGQTVDVLIGFLLRLVKKIGTLEKIDESVIKKLLVGDLNYLLVAVRCESLGKELEFEIQCPKCKNQEQFSQDLTELSVIELGDEDPREFTVELEKGYVDETGKAHKTAKVQFLSVADQEKMGSALEDPARVMNMLLVKSIVQLGGLPAVSLQIVKSLTKKDRDKIFAEIRNRTPGINLNADIECSSCGYKSKVPIGLESFFGFRAV